MLILKRLLLGAATLILVETAAVTPAQAFTLSFQSTDGRVTGKIVGQDSGIGISTLSLSGPGSGFSGNLFWSEGSGNQGFQRLGQGSFTFEQVFQGIPYSNLELAFNMPFILPHNWVTLHGTITNVKLNLFCHSESDCLGDPGTISIDLSYAHFTGMYSWTGYSGDIKVTAWQATSTSPLTTLPNSGSNSTSTPTLPTNSVPEPSSAFALLLLGSGWLLRRKLAIN